MNESYPDSNVQEDALTNSARDRLGTQFGVTEGYTPRGPLEKSPLNPCLCDQKLSPQQQSVRLLGPSSRFETRNLPEGQFAEVLRLISGKPG